MGKENIQGVIFDFNGVLLWDAAFHERAWQEFAKKLRGAPLSDEEIMHHVHRRNSRHTFEYIIGRQASDDELGRLQEKELMYRSFILEQGEGFKLSPGAVELLDFLVQRKIPHTIATASEITNLRFFFEHLRLDTWFEFDAVVYDDGTIPGKPSPDIYLKAARNLNLNPVHCMVIEDATSGIKAAHTAGIGWIVALGRKDKHEALAKLEGVDQVISELGELVSFFNE